MVSLHFDIKKKAYGSDHKYFLRILKDETGAEVQSRQVIMDLPFTDDETGAEVQSRQVIMDLPFTDDFGFGV